MMLYMILERRIRHIPVGCFVGVDIEETCVVETVTLLVVLVHCFVGVEVELTCVVETITLFVVLGPNDAGRSQIKCKSNPQLISYH